MKVHDWIVKYSRKPLALPVGCDFLQLNSQDLNKYWYYFVLPQIKAKIHAMCGYLMNIRPSILIFSFVFLVEVLLLITMHHLHLIRNDSNARRSLFLFIPSTCAVGRTHICPPSLWRHMGQKRVLALRELVVVELSARRRSCQSFPAK